MWNPYNKSYLFYSQDLLYDSASSSGFVYNAMRYRKTKARAGTKSKINDVTSDLENLRLIDKVYTEDEKEDLRIFFKTCLAHKDESLLIEKMKESVQFRCELIKDKVNLTETFPFYFASPKLVRIYLLITYSNTKLIFFIKYFHI